MKHLKEGFLSAAELMMNKNDCFVPWGMCELVPTAEHIQLLRQVMAPTEVTDDSVGYWAKGWGLRYGTFSIERSRFLADSYKKTQKETDEYNRLCQTLNNKQLKECRVLGLLFMAEFVDSL
jgi:hypothetical protein